MMLSGVAKSGSPISRWTTCLPSASSRRALASTSNAPSVPKRDMRSAKRIVMPESYPSRSSRTSPKPKHREDRSVHHDLRAVDLLEKPVDGEVALVDHQPRPISQGALLGPLPKRPRGRQLVQDHELGRDASHFRQQVGSVIRRQVAIEVRGKRPLEAVIDEWKRRDHRSDLLCRREPGPRDREHRWARIQERQLARQPAADEARATAYVDSLGGGERFERGADRAPA